MQIYSMSYHGVLVAALGEYHAGHGGIPAHDYEKENGHEGGPYLAKAATDTC